MEISEWFYQGIRFEQRFHGGMFYVVYDTNSVGRKRTFGVMDDFGNFAEV
jgi:hypothetical protein